MRLLSIFILTILLITVGQTAGWCEGKTTDQALVPEVKEGIIAIEGRPEKFTLLRVDGGPLPFYTYVPHDMETERFSGPEGTGVRFWLNRGGDEKRNDVYVSIFAFPPGTTSEQTKQIIDELMNKLGLVRYELKTKEKSFFPWALFEVNFTADWYSKLPLGLIAVGQHGDMFFCVMEQSRQSFNDGFIPRYLRILDEFVWTDTNEKLR